MKKNWISIVSLVLNVVLLVFVIGLAAKLERTEENLRGGSAMWRATRRFG